MATITYLTEKGVKSRWWDFPVIAMSGLLTVVAVDVSVDSFVAHEPVSSFAASACVVLLMLLPAWLVVTHRLRQASARKLAKAFELCRNDSISYADLQKRTGIKDIPEAVRKLIAKGYLTNIAVDSERQSVRLVKLWNAASPGQQAILDTGNAEFDEKLSEIRKMNDEIKNLKVSGKIDRIEQLTASIFQVINEKPDRADDARRFMNYYLPTTMKLLESYRLMEKQSYQGENIQHSRQKIEEVLDTMIHAMEGQQDKLFTYDVLDVESDITVLETLMAADGLSEKGALPRQM